MTCTKASSVLHNLSLYVSAPDHRDPAVKPLWSFHWGIWQNVSSISIKGVKGLGKRLSNPRNWHHHPPLHPFSQMWPKIWKLVFCLVSIMAKQRDTESVTLVRRPQREQKAAVFISSDRLSRGENAAWGQHLARIKGRKTKDRVVSIFWNESSQNNPTWDDIAKLFALRGLGEWIAKHYLTEGKYTQMSNTNAWPAEKLYVMYCVPTPAATFLREQYMVTSKSCIARWYFVRTIPFVSPPEWLCKLPRYTLYGNGEETSVFNYSAWLTVGPKQYKAFQPSSTGLAMNYGC